LSNLSHAQAQEKDAATANFATAQFGPAPDIPAGPLPNSIQFAARVAFIDSMTLGVWGENQDLALDAIAKSKDPRLGWIISDMLRFISSSRPYSTLTRAATELLGKDFNANDSWPKITNHLIAWDIPAPPNYLDFKRAIFTPVVSTAEEATWLKDEDIVFGIQINGESRAYPRRIMEVREMVNDTLGGRDLGIPYCTLCASAQAYFTDQFITTDWGTWKQEHPETTVLLERYALGRDPDHYNKRDANGPIFPIGDVDPRLAVHEDIIGAITASGKPVAFPRSTAFIALKNGDEVSVENIRLELTAGGIKAVDNNDKKADLGSHQAFWFAWSQFYPQTMLWSPRQ